MGKPSLRHKSSRFSLITGIIFLVALISGAWILVSTLSPALTGVPYVQRIQQSQIRQTLQRTQQQPAHSRLYIPKLGVNIAIVEGADSQALLQGAWHRQPQNGNPVIGGNFVLSAHRFNMGYTPAGTIKKSPFYHIDRLQADDVITVDYKQKRYRYSVSRLYQVSPNHIQIEGPSETAKLTLYSCTLGGSADGRVVVEAFPE